MSQPIGNPSPKARFQQSVDNIKKHRELIDSSEFQRGADFALLEYNGQCLTCTTGNEALAAAFKLQGAVEFLQTFRMLSEKPLPPSTVRAPALDHGV